MGSEGKASHKIDAVSRLTITNPDFVASSPEYKIRESPVATLEATLGTSPVNLNLGVVSFV